MKDLHNPDEESIYLQYLDGNNLYGWAMIQKLPTHGFLSKEAEDFTPKKIDKLVKKDKERISSRGRCRVSKRAAQKSQRATVFRGENENQKEGEISAKS